MVYFGDLKKKKKRKCWLIHSVRRGILRILGTSESDCQLQALGL